MDYLSQVLLFLIMMINSKFIYKQPTKFYATKNYTIQVERILFAITILLRFTRYTAFIVLYPPGMAGESKFIVSISLWFQFFIVWKNPVPPLPHLSSLSFSLDFCVYNAAWLMYQALPFVKKTSVFPNFFAGLSYYNFLRVCSDFFYHELQYICFFFPPCQLGTHGIG